MATNAGGLRYIKYGSLHGNVLGLEVVLSNGQVVDLLSKMRKDNTGYHLRHLFIGLHYTPFTVNNSAGGLNKCIVFQFAGSEGTLGIITKVAILCPMLPKHKIVSLIALESFKKLLELYATVQRELGEYVSCFEMMDTYSIEAVVNNLKYPQPFSERYPFYVMFELSSNDGPYLEGRLLSLLERLDADKAILNGTFVSDSDQQKFAKLRSYRENITHALNLDGRGSYKYDISLDLSVYYQIVEIMRKKLQENNCQFTTVCGYGHIGDCNLHFNVTSKEFDPKILNLIEPSLYEFVAKHRGSISAEHGIGYKKRQYLSYSKTPEAIQLMKQIKHLLDPKQILNPNKLF